MTLEIVIFAICFRLIPIILLFNAKNKNFFTLGCIVFCCVSFLADFVSMEFALEGWDTLNILGLFNASQAILVPLILTSSYSFSTFYHYGLIVTGVVSASVIVFCTFIYSNASTLSIAWGFSNAILAISCIFTMLKIGFSLKRKDLFFPISLTPLFGLFIYTSFSVIPQASHFLQIVSDDKALASNLYVVFMLSGNLLRDLLFSIYGLRLIKKAKITIQ